MVKVALLGRIESKSREREGAGRVSQVGAASGGAREGHCQLVCSEDGPVELWDI